MGFQQLFKIYTSVYLYAMGQIVGLLATAALGGEEEGQCVRESSEEERG